MIDKLNVTFHRFVFPVGVDIHFDLQELDHNRSDRFKAKACISFRQCGELACAVDVSYTAIQDARLRPREEQLTRDVLSYTLNTYQPTVSGMAQALTA